MVSEYEGSFRGASMKFLLTYGIETTDKPENQRRLMIGLVVLLICGVFL